jgi:hypothetical protein
MVRGENGSSCGIVLVSTTSAAGQGVHAEHRLAILIMRAVRRALLENDQAVCCLQLYLSYVGFEDLRAVAMKSYNVV